GARVAQAVERAVADRCALEEQRGLVRMIARPVGEVIDQRAIGVRGQRAGNAFVVVREPGRVHPRAIISAGARARLEGVSRSPSGLPAWGRPEGPRYATVVASSISSSAFCPCRRFSA